MALQEQIYSCLATAGQRASFGAEASQTVRGTACLPSDLGLQHLGCPLLSLDGCPALLLGVAALGAERAEGNVASITATPVISLQIHLQQRVMPLVPSADCSRADPSRRGRVGGQDHIAALDSPELAVPNDTSTYLC